MRYRSFTLKHNHDHSDGHRLYWVAVEDEKTRKYLYVTADYRTESEALADARKWVDAHLLSPRRRV